MRKAVVVGIATVAVLAFVFLVPIQPTNWQPGAMSCTNSSGQLTSLCSSIEMRGYVSLTYFFIGAGGQYNTITNRYSFVY